MDKNELTITLEDGRQLAFAEYGDANGTPVFFFHGLPSCRLMHPNEAVCAELSVRLLVPDRPGFGLSDSKPDRTLLDWPDDLCALADALGISNFHIVGASGGAPFVAAAAYKLGSRVTSAAIVSGSGPVDAPGAMKGIALERRIGYYLARRYPRIFRWIIPRRGDPQKDVEKFFANYTRHNPPEDQAILARPEIKEMFLTSFKEATRQGFEPFVWEVGLVASSWGFQLEEIRVPVTIWHGDADNSTPLGMAQALANKISQSRLQIVPGQGHMIHFSHWREILEDLIAAGPRPCGQ